MTKTYTRRSEDDLIAEYEAKIEAAKVRAAAKQAKAVPEVAAALAAARALQAASVAAKAGDNAPMAEALEKAVKPLGTYLDSIGLALPAPRKPRAKKDPSAPAKPRAAKPRAKK
jgi:hypothetical protein